MRLRNTRERLAQNTAFWRTNLERGADTSDRRVQQLICDLVLIEQMLKNPLLMYVEADYDLPIQTSRRQRRQQGLLWTPPLS